MNRPAPSVPESSPPTSCRAAATLVLGIGCRRHASLAQIEAAVRAALGERPLGDVGLVATVENKADEPALLAFCAAHALPLRVFARARLTACPASGAPSPAARAHLGVDGVCEPCARLGADGGPLVQGKIARDGVTVALARRLPSERDDRHPAGAA
ncbi:cobalamin biosynthesis protein CbiG [Burkholderia sp. WAC0059]|uniref:cobalamin biosynthesis protein n=1 Tax=Burkholderia sp. WAC0059 TaxID=2066022 RepID=UPI000C7EEFE7|nr:cobalamin biosynthesis protein [Burkholderia sp. WAC0059]PLZ03833.1 cobalamin biosynthesis protein CbiG [Burkholderia sp. WAC0059]